MPRLVTTSPPANHKPARLPAPALAERLADLGLDACPLPMRGRAMRAIRRDRSAGYVAHRRGVTPILASASEEG